MHDVDDNDQPSDLRKTLYPHQWNAIKMMEMFEQKKNQVSDNLELRMGIYSDDIGHGKTLVIIALILRNRLSWNNIHQPYTQQSIYDAKEDGLIVKKSYKRIHPTLIVASASAIGHWRNEIKETPLTFFMIDKQTKIASDIFRYDIVLSLPCFYNRLVHKYDDCAWRRFIYDEPVYTKISSMKPIVSRFIWLITPCPYELLTCGMPNHYLFDIFSHLDVFTFQGLLVRNENVVIQTSVTLPMIHVREYCFIRPRDLQCVSDVVSGDMIECVADEPDAIEDIITSLQISSTCDIFKFAKKFFPETMKKKFLEIAKHWLETSLQRCRICLEIPRRSIFVTCCFHIFCGPCIVQWLLSKNTCPICYTILFIHQLVALNSAGRNDYHPLVVQKTKIETAMAILMHQGRYILHSHDPAELEIFKCQLIKVKFFFLEIKGTISQRERQISLYNRSNHCILLCRSVANLLGVNLQTTSDIIFCTPVDDLIRRQIIGIGYRLGRVENLTVHLLF